MADDMGDDPDALFDFSKKKKKKKKKPINLDEDEGLVAATETLTVEEADTTERKPVENTDNLTEDEAALIYLDELVKDDFGITSDGKYPDVKRKRRAVVFDDDTAAGDEDAELIDAFSLPKKKKKVRADDDMGDLDDDDLADDVGFEGEEPSNSSQPMTSEDVVPWADSDRDYRYSELLLRVFNILRSRNPDFVAGERRRFVMKPPQVLRVGTRKTAFANFIDITKLLHRQPDHLLAFMMAELGTSGTVDGSNQLIMKGRFQQKHIENVLRRYIREYVTCHTCRSPDTLLTKENRLFFLQCETCGSTCSVATIKLGFQAVTSKRSRLRK